MQKGSTRTVIFNLSGVYAQEGMTCGEAPWQDAEVVDLSDIDGTVCYCDEDSAETIRARIEGLGLPDGVPSICWIDSGDYHYMSLFRTENIAVPFQLLLVDHHPDMQAPLFGDVISCGGWLRLLARSNPNLRRIVIKGVNPELEGETVEFRSILSDTPDPSLPVFLSIDKDALSQDYSRTNWDQGSMTYGQLETVVGQVLATCSCLGVDICGEKPQEKGGDGEDMRMNLDLNRRLQTLLQEKLG